MASEVVTQAINETIKPNGQRAITAESFAALLHLMNEQGGGGAGSLEIKIGTLAEGADGMITSILSSEDRTHNQEVFQKMKETTQSGTPPPSLTCNFGQILSQIEPEIGVYIPELSIYFNNIIYGYVNSPLLGSEIGYSEMVFSYALVMLLILLEDGTVILSGSI